MIRAKKITVSGLFLALALLLPLFTGQIPQIGAVLSPMHIPVLLCGFVCGWPYGLFIGAVAPSLRFLMFGMPPLFPIGAAMTFELAAYGFSSGVLYGILPKKTASIYISLISSMLIGRLVWGAAMYLIALTANINFGIDVFLAGAFINALPGIILHIIIIPIIVLALKKAGYLLNDTVAANNGAF